MGRPPILDNHTNKGISRQRKHQLRNPEKLSEIQRKFRQSEKRKAYMREYNRRYRLEHPK